MSRPKSSDIVRWHYSLGQSEEGVTGIMGSDAGDAAEVARKHLIESHLPLVRSIARRYADRDEALDDLVQVGALESIKASDRFDPNQGVSFADFATPSIEEAIRKQLEDRVPTQQAHGELQLRRDIERVRGAKQANRELPIPANTGQADLTSEAEESGSSEGRLLETRGLRSLDEQERQIMLLWFRGDLTEREIGRRREVSQEHISQLLTTALEKLRTDLAGSELSSVPVISPGAHRAGSGERLPEAEERDIGSRRPSGTPEVRDDLRSAASARSEPTPTRASRGRRGSAKSKGATTHSGRFLLRMPSELHQQVAREAERRQVSLNRFITGLVSDAVSPDPPGSTTSAVGPGDAPTAEPPDLAIMGADPADAPAAKTDPGEPPPAKEDPANAPAAEDNAPGEDPSHEASQTFVHPSPQMVRFALMVNLAAVVVAGIVAIVLLAHGL